MANSIDPDQLPHSVVSDLGLHCLLRTVCLSSQGYYGSVFSSITDTQEKGSLDILKQLISRSSSAKLNSEEPEIFLSNKYENANNSWHFHIY